MTPRRSKLWTNHLTLLLLLVGCAVEAEPMAPPGEDNSQGLLLDAKKYGVTCDGLTNDAAAIQAAMDVGNVLLPAGVCNIGTTSLLIKRDSQVLTGQVSGGSLSATDDTIIKYTGTDYALKN